VISDELRKKSSILRIFVLFAFFTFSCQFKYLIVAVEVFREWVSVVMMLYLLYVVAVGTDCIMVAMMIMVLGTSDIAID
jgi:hypothetical protein